MKYLTPLGVSLFLLGTAAGVAESPQELEDGVDEHHVISLILNKPLGLIVEPPYSSVHGIGSGVIVASLQNEEEKVGSVHKLPKKLQDELVGSRIIAINDENTTMHSLSRVTKLITQAENPIRIDFDLDEESDEQEDEDNEVVGYASHVQDEVVPGQVSPMRWKDSGEIIDSRASRVGLPRELMATIQSFVEQVRLVAMLKDMLFTKPCGGRQGRFYRSNTTDDEEMLWYAQRPYLLSNWDADLHYFSPADEKTYEAVLKMLFQGGFRMVIEAIGKHFNLDSLAVQGIGFLGVTYCEDGSIHRDFPKLGGRAFNLLLPIHSVEGSGPELTVAGWKSMSAGNTTASVNEDDDEKDDVNTKLIGTAVKYSPDIGMLMGDSTWHGTRACDNRPMNDARIMMNIFLVDLTEVNVGPISADMIDIFPVPGNAEWLWAQRGRHWRNDMCMDLDHGRLPFQIKDQRVDCLARAKLGECESIPNPTRLKCPMSCKVYVEDADR